MQAEGRIARAVILDCDVHQGNGTAAIFATDPSVFTFSIHGANNFPFRKVEGDLDIPLPDGTSGDVYLEVLERGMDRALAGAGAELAIYLAGADPFEGDRYGKLALTSADLADRDRIVFLKCRGAGLPVATVMSGGYADNVSDIVDIHFATVRAAAYHAGG
jgi:acetoin utilization deacetylase AcuC-like enzyme